MSDTTGNIPDYKDENCTMCKFYSKAGRQCYRYPPRRISYTEIGRPHVGFLDWCGEFIQVAENGG